MNTNSVGMRDAVIFLGAIYIARKIPFDDPVILSYVRLGYILSKAIIIGTYLFVSFQIKQKNDRTVLKYVDPPSPMAMFRWVADPLSWSPDSVGLVTTTVSDYDLSETSKLLRGAFFDTAIMALLHIYMKYNQILFIQTLVNLTDLYDKHVVAIHVLGKPTRDFQRPFKLGLFGPTADPAAIAEAEQRIRAGEEYMARAMFQVNEDK